MFHFRHCHMRCVGITQHDHAERIADKNQRNAGFIEKFCHGKIIGRERGNFFAAAFIARIVSAVILEFILEPRMETD